MAITLAQGRRLPRFRLQFHDPLTSTAETRQSSHIDLNPDIESMSFQTQTDGGFTALSVGYDKLIKFPASGEEKHFRSLQRPVEIKDFAHVRLSEGTRTVWEGRVLLPELPGGKLRAFQAKGYGYTALQDQPYLNGLTTETTSGAIFAEALRSCCPMLTIPGSTDWFVDPGVPHTPSEFFGKKPAQIFAQIQTDGDIYGNQQIFTVYEHRRVSLLPMVAPSRPTYIVDFNDDVQWQRNLEPAFGALYYFYSGGSAPYVYVEAPQSLAVWQDQHGGLIRIDSQNGGTMTDTEAKAKAQTLINLSSNPAIAGTFTAGGRYKGDVQGLRLAKGGTRAPWLVRAGETIEVGDQGVFFIAHTDFDCNTLQLSVSINQIAFGHARTQAKLRNVAGHAINSTNPVSGVAA